MPFRCKELERKYHDRGCKCIRYREEHPACECERYSVSDHSPGLVRDDELLIRTLYWGLLEIRLKCLDPSVIH